LVDEGLDRGGEAVVGMVDEDVALPQHFEDISRLAEWRAELGWSRPEPRLRLQRRPVQVRERAQVAAVEQAVDHVEIRALQTELAEEDRAEILRH